MKIMIVNSKIKQKSKTIFRVIRNLVLDFILYFVTVYIIWERIHVTWAQGKTSNTLCIAWGSKKKNMTNNLQQQLHTKIFKIITMKYVHVM